MPIPIQSPGGYVASRAAAFADTDGSALMVSAAQPLPVTIGAAPASAPLSGTATMAALAGPFLPVPGRAAILALGGTWSGSVRLLRSTDGGATKQPVTFGGTEWAVFQGNCCEPVWEETEAGAQLYLDLTLTQGAVDYRLAQ